jgi:uncharacterized protein YkwD
MEFRFKPPSRFLEDRASGKTLIRADIVPAVKRALLLVACFGALASPASAMAACPGENDTVTLANVNEAAGAMACLVNEYRVSKGLDALANNDILAASGAAHSQDMVARRYFSHFAAPPAGADPLARDVLLGYPSNTTIGENIGWRNGSPTPALLMSSFKASPDHNANMLDPAWKEAGYGFALGNPGLGNGVVVSQEFGSGASGGGGGGGGGGTSSCPEGDRLVAKLKKLIKNGAPNRKISKTKKALKRARAACR